MPRSTPKHLKISFVYDDSLDGFEGVSQYLKTLGPWLIKRGHQVSYLVGQTSINEYQKGRIFSLSRNIKVKFNGNRLSIPLFSKKRELELTLSKLKPDIIHVQVPYSPLMAQRIINLNTHSGLVGTFHIFPAGRLVRLASRALRLAYGRSLRKFDSIISVSPAAQSFAKQVFGINSGIIPNMVNLEMYRSVNKKTDFNKIVFVGRLVERKGCRYLIEAFALAVQKNPELRLTIAGKGAYQSELEKLAQKLGLAGKISFPGFISEEDKVDLVSDAAVACYPSLYGESFGIVLIEAMAGGSAVVLAGDNPGYTSVLGEKTELIFKPKDVPTLAQKILKCSVDSPARRQLIDWQNQQVKRYDVELVGRQIEEWYDSVIAKGARNRHNNN